MARPDCFQCKSAALRLAAVGVMLVAVLAANSNAAEPESPIRVLIVTGEDHPGHLWKETSPALRSVLEQDGGIDVRIIDDVELLSSEVLFDYDVLFLHLKNYSPVKRADAVQANMKKFVQQGGGLVLFHFACGAFQEWPGFKQLAGRVWGPKLRAHDPRGPFQVDIVDTPHPITSGVTAFETNDELYTCLAGDMPIEVLATATSKVDGLVYPMAFVFDVGQGRVFHTVLGHSVEAIEVPEVGQLLRQGCHWVAKDESQ